MSVAACASLLSKSELAHTMAVGAAFEALRATLDLVSQTKNGGSFFSSWIFSPSVMEGVFFKNHFHINFYN